MTSLDHTSHSQISMWIRCPRQWEYRYVKGLKMPPSGPLIEGGCYHKALEVNFRQKMTTFEDLPVDDCLDAYSDEWRIRLSQEEYVDWGGSSPNHYKDEGIALVTEYIASTAFTVQPVIVEQSLVSEIAGVKFLCVPDLEDINKVVIDHKTSAKSYSQIDVDYNIQATAEAFAIGRPIVFQNHVAVKTKVPRIQIVRSYRTRTDIEWWYSMATGIVRQMKTGVAPPRPVDAFGKAGFWCSKKFCGFYDECRPGLTRNIFT